MGGKRRAAQEWENGGRCRINLAGKVEDGWFNIRVPYKVVEQLGGVNEVGVVVDEGGMMHLDPILDRCGHYAEAIAAARDGDAQGSAGGSGSAVVADDKHPSGWAKWDATL